MSPDPSIVRVNYFRNLPAHKPAQFGRVTMDVDLEGFQLFAAGPFGADGRIICG